MIVVENKSYFYELAKNCTSILGTDYEKYCFLVNG